MQITSISLRNIRSYSNHEIAFPSGSILLSGDIGAGKSSILLAVEFALFGIRRGDLSGSMLLSHGQREGSVELALRVSGKDVIIKRTLKRSNEEVKQDSGYIITNGRKKDCSPVELKAEVLSLLGYPKELLSKPKDLLFRFTVYTPQEDMKAILTEPTDARLDTLRKVLNVDKYKNIAYNSSIVARDIKERKKVIDAKTSDLQEKIRQRDSLREELGKVLDKIAELSPRREKAAQDIKSMKESIVALEEDMKKLAEIRRGVAMCDVELRNLIDLRVRAAEDTESIQNEISILERDTINRFPEDLLEKKKEKEALVQEFEKKVKEVIATLGKLKAKKSASEDTKRKVLELDNCPVCLQPVSTQHKAAITRTEDSRLADISEFTLNQEEKLRKYEGSLVKYRMELEEVRNKAASEAVIRHKLDSLKNLRAKCEKLKLGQAEIKSKVGNINMKKAMLNEELQRYSNAEERFALVKNDLDASVSTERELALQLASLEKSKENSENNINSLEREISEKNALRGKFLHLSQTQAWIEDFFINLVNTMEKHVMVRIHHEFNGLFQRWFGILIEDEAISVRLDDEFTPIVEQNGFETTVESLSGGERTSVALAYRLALNKVINDVVSTINTKDIIILDEPTDGFSTEQLDKVREVLDQLNMSQIIIVSHESKIESFVDHVIRIRKGEQGSQAS